MKFILIIGGITVLCALFPFVRCIVFNPHYSSYYGVTDLYHYIKYKLSNNSNYGELVGYTGLFGKGKTLSMVHDVVHFYHRYNGKKFFDVKRGKWVTNCVVVLSNVDISIPYIKLNSLQQIVDNMHHFYALMCENDCDINYMTYICLDEASTQLNSRNFKTNFNALFLNTLLTCRHYNCVRFAYSTQRFSHVDALMRQVTQAVYDCDKIWRVQIMRKYDAYELENCTNPLLIKPLSVRVWFVRNKDYDNYNTLACVDNLIHDFENGDMYSETEILQLLQPISEQNPDNVTHYSKKASKRKKFAKKRG